MSKNTKNTKNTEQSLTDKLQQIALSDNIKYFISKIPLALCIIFAFLAIAQVIYYTVGPAEGYFHADCTDTIYWAQASVDGGSVFNSDFYYAALLPFGASIWLVPLIHIFGVTMGVHVAGMVIFAVLFFASVIFLCRSMEWSWEWSLFTSASVMLMLSSSDKMREIMWGHVIYYSLGLLILFVGLGLLFRLCRHLELGNKRKAVVYASLFFAFMALAATNGTQCIAIYTLPILAAVCAEIVFNSGEKLVSKHNRYHILSVCILAFSTIVGMGLLSLVKGDIIAGYAEAYSLLDSVSKWTDNLLKFPESYFTLWGISIADGADMAAKDTIFNLVKLAASLVCLVLPAMLFVCYKKIEDRNTKIIAWTHFAVSAVIMVGFVCGRLSAGNWRLIPMVGTSIIASIAAIRVMLSMKECALSWRRVGALLALIPLLCSLVNYKMIDDMPKDYGRDNDLHQLAEFLEENDLEYGYTEFWKAQAITLISDSRVKVRGITVSRQDGIDPYLYQSNKNWYEDQEGVDKYFIILSASEYSQLMNGAEWKTRYEQHFVERLECVGYHIFVFDSNIFIEEAPAQ